MSTTLELISGELVTLAAGRVGEERVTQLQITGRRVSDEIPRDLYRPVDAVVLLRPEEVARLAVALVQRLLVATTPASVRLALEADLRRLGFAE